MAGRIGVVGGDSATQASQAIDAAETRIRAAVPAARTIYLEPDIYRP